MVKILHNTEKMKATEFKKLIREEVRRVLKEELDPNATYKINISISRGEYDPGDIEKVAGEPLAVAKAVKKEAHDDLIDADYDDGDALEFINAYKLDQDTYIIGTGEEDVVIVGRPKSKKYGAFWSDPTSEESEDLYYQMEEDIQGAQEVSGMGGTVSSLGKVATKPSTKPQSSGGDIKVGDVVTTKASTSKYKVVQIYPDKKALAAAMLKLPKKEMDRSRERFDQVYANRFDKGPFAHVVHADGVENLYPYMIVFATSILTKK